MKEVVAEFRGVVPAVHAAIDLAEARGQLISIISMKVAHQDSRMMVARVRLFDPHELTRTRSAKRSVRRRLVVAAASLVAIVALVWVVWQLLVWVGHHWVGLLGAGVVFLFLVGGLTRVMVGGDSHPCNR